MCGYTVCYVTANKQPEELSSIDATDSFEQIILSVLDPSQSF